MIRRIDGLWSLIPVFRRLIVFHVMSAEVDVMSDRYGMPINDCMENILFSRIRPDHNQK